MLLLRSQVINTCLEQCFKGKLKLLSVYIAQMQPTYAVQAPQPLPVAQPASYPQSAFQVAPLGGNSYVGKWACAKLNNFSTIYLNEAIFYNFVINFDINAMYSIFNNVTIIRSHIHLLTLLNWKKIAEICLRNMLFYNKIFLHCVTN